MNVRAIEVGYGTNSLTARVENGVPIIKTFPSIAVPVQGGGDLSGGLSRRDTVRVQIDDDVFEVGPDAHLLSDRTSSRVLSSSYIDTPQYRALLLGSLSYMDVDSIDLLVLALPVNNQHRAGDLKKLALGKHKVSGDRVIEVKDVWVLCQPLAGYIYYAHSIGKEKFKAIKSQNVLSIDFGFTTVDWVTSRGLKVNEKKSGAEDMGMSAILEICQQGIANAFPNLGQVQHDIIDNAFWHEKGVLRIAGKPYPFPVCKGQLVDGRPTNVNYDLTGAIRQVAKSAMQAVQNSVRNGAEISQIIVMGGSHTAYLDEVRAAYPEHEIAVIDNPLTAVCLGMYYGGCQYIAQKQQAEVAA